MKQYPNWEVHREGNNWDVFLNYFFAVLFLCCLVVGIFLNPFIITYHSRQKKTFATILFLLVSSIDQFKSLYFPLVFIPKLLSPLDDEDFYFIEKVKSVHWTTHSNGFFAYLGFFEMDLLVVLCIARYMSITNPLSSAKKRVIFLSSVLVLSLTYWLVSALLVYFYNERDYMRLYDLVFPCQDPAVTMTKIYLENGWSCFLMLCGGVFSVLTIRYLKNCDPASSTASSKNIRRGIVSLIAMNVFNVVVLICTIADSITLFYISRAGLEKASTGINFILFANCYGATLCQSAFNSLSFLLLCGSFRTFVKKMVRERSVGPQSVNESVTQKTLIGRASEQTKVVE